MKFGLMTFPGLFNHFYGKDTVDLAQRLEPSVLYVVPSYGQSEFIPDNQPKDDIDIYLCSVYTRGWGEFKEFAKKVGRGKIIAGGYHPTAVPEDTFKYAHKVVVGYCNNIDEIITGDPGIVRGRFGFTPLRRDLIDMKRMMQIYPDIRRDDISGSMVSSVGCPYACEFCSTPNMSGRRMKMSEMEYVEKEIQDLKDKRATTVFIRDESFATNSKLKEFAPLFKDKFRILYSFGTGAVMASRPELIKVLVENGWHSLNFGLEDIGVKYNKNKNLAQAAQNCRDLGMKYVLSFIVNDRGKTKEEARANYNALYQAFIDLKPSQVCANFLMPFPGTQLWKSYKDIVKEEDFEKFDSKTPLFSSKELANWHKRMLVAVQLKYYISNEYNKQVRKFDCGDSLYLRMTELSKEFQLTNIEQEQLLEIN